MIQEVILDIVFFFLNYETIYSRVKYRIQTVYFPVFKIPKVVKWKENYYI